MLNDIITMYPQTSCIFKNILGEENLSPCCQLLFEEIIKTKELPGGGQSLFQPSDNRAKAEIVKTLATFVVDQKAGKE